MQGLGQGHQIRQTAAGGSRAYHPSTDCAYLGQVHGTWQRISIDRYVFCLYIRISVLIEGIADGVRTCVHGRMGEICVAEAAAGSHNPIPMPAAGCGVYPLASTGKRPGAKEGPAALAVHAHARAPNVQLLSARERTRRRTGHGPDRPWQADSG